MLAVIAEQWCRPPPRQQAGSGLLAVASTAGAKNAPSVSSSSVMAVDRRMRELGDYTEMRTAVVPPTVSRKMLALTVVSY